jgi:rRNA maturation endonuclease Nob1
MPPPYLLEIMLVVEEHADAELIRVEFVKQLFETKIADPENQDVKRTRAELARRNGIRILSEGVMAKSVTEITLYELMGLVRFSMVDHLSDSSMAAGF